MSNSTNTCAASWTLTEIIDGKQQQRSIDLPSRVLFVGRTSDNDLIVNATAVSKRHARIIAGADHLAVADLGSTNGTFVNGDRIESRHVLDGDLLQFGTAVYRVGRRSDAILGDTLEESFLPWTDSLIEFDELICNRNVTPNFQRIIRLTDGQTVGYEMLARSELDLLMQPNLMFAAAESLGQEAVLSEMLREIGMSAIASAGKDRFDTFLNTHPLEFDTPRLGASLISLRQQFPDLPITIEVNEAVVADVAVAIQFHRLLNSLDMQLAYDNFGMGESRLIELSEAAPDILKFDMGLIRDIDSAPSSRQLLLGRLVSIAKGSGSLTLAEGVETQAEHEVCCQLGFDLGQGFLFGRPGLLDEQ